MYIKTEVTMKGLGPLELGGLGLGEKVTSVFFLVKFGLGHFVL